MSVQVITHRLLSYAGEDLSAVGQTQYPAIYRYDGGAGEWVKVGGTVNENTATIEAPIDTLGFYTISADLPEDTTPPEVTIVNPPNDGIVVEDTTAIAVTNDDLGAYKVDFYMSDHPLTAESDYTEGFTVRLPVTDYCTGDWTLKAVAEDLAGNQGTAQNVIHIQSATPPPTVSIANPSEGATLSGTVGITGTCWDDVSVARVTLYADETVIGYGEPDGTGGWTAEIDTTYVANGARALKSVVEDYPGNTATASVNVTFANGSTGLADAKSLPDGQVARLDGMLVTAGADEIGGAFYMQATDRSSGVRVASEHIVHRGDLVNVAGVLETVATERQIAAMDVMVISTGNSLPAPLGVVNLALGGGDLGYQPGVTGGFGLNNIGLLIRAWGKVTEPGENCFWIDDGSGITTDTGHLGVRVVTEGITLPEGVSQGAFVVVTGISSCIEIEGGAIVRRVLARKTEDIAVIQPSAPLFPIGQAKQQPDGTMVKIQGVVSWAGSGFFYCQAFDRSSGIRVNSSASVIEGQDVEVVGTMTTVSGERQINASSVRTL